MRFNIITFVAMYAIIDIETTGGSGRKDKITEIAIFIHDGKKIVKEYQTLINPECNIPYNITQLTGINNEMVENAPRFYEVAKDIVEITAECIFVAHNVTFDYGFVKAEFQQLGFSYQRETLCTVKLSRKYLPGHRSYSLGNLCNDLNIGINGRHRAGGDALATCELFDILLEKNGGELFLPENRIFSKKNLHPSMDTEKILSLPDECGVYYFYNQRHDLIYIGKSKNIKKRVLQHINNIKSSRAMKMVSEITDIDFVLTGSELIALLKESHEIKQEKPLYNRAQRRSVYHYGAFLKGDASGYLNIDIRKIEDEDPITSFTSMEEAKASIERLCKKYELCQKLCGLYKHEGPCFQYQIRECKGACMGEEFPFSYNARVEEMLHAIQYSAPNMIIFDKGRNANEKAIVWIEKGKYCGYGYFPEEDAVGSAYHLKEYIDSYSDNREVQQIINSYLNKNKRIKTHKFK